MIAPMERDWVLKAVVSAVALDAAPTARRIELDFGWLWARTAVGDPPDA